MTTFRKWEDLSEVEQLQVNCYEAFKDVYGFRYRGVIPDTVEGLQKWLGELSDEIGMQEAAREAREQEETAVFEAKIAKICNELSRTRETVIRWMFDAGNYNGDWDFMCYDQNLPYGYFKEFYNAA